MKKSDKKILLKNYINNKNINIDDYIDFCDKNDILFFDYDILKITYDNNFDLFKDIFKKSFKTIKIQIFINKLKKANILKHEFLKDKPNLDKLSQYFNILYDLEKSGAQIVDMDFFNLDYNKLNNKIDIIKNNSKSFNYIFKDFINDNFSEILDNKNNILEFLFKNRLDDIVELSKSQKLTAKILYSNNIENIINYYNEIKKDIHRLKLNLIIKYSLKKDNIKPIIPIIKILVKDFFNLIQNRETLQFWCNKYMKNIIEFTNYDLQFLLETLDIYNYAENFEQTSFIEKSIEKHPELYAIFVLYGYKINIIDYIDNYNLFKQSIETINNILNNENIDDKIKFYINKIFKIRHNEIKEYSEFLKDNAYNEFNYYINKLIKYKNIVPDNMKNKLIDTFIENNDIEKDI